MSGMQTSLIVAVARNGVIGREGDLPWRLPADLREFKRRTLGHHILMGRKTFVSLGRPLPGRPNVVLSRDPDFSAEGASVVHDLPSALRFAEAAGETEAFVIGGAAVYAAAMSVASRIYLTRVHADVEGDVYLRDVLQTVDAQEWTEVERVDHPADDRHLHPFSLCVYARTM